MPALLRRGRVEWAAEWTTGASKARDMIDRPRAIDVVRVDPRIGGEVATTSRARPPSRGQERTRLPTRPQFIPPRPPAATAAAPAAPPATARRDGHWLLLRH